MCTVDSIYDPSATGLQDTKTEGLAREPVGML